MTLDQISVIKKGGAGSGHFDHAGRPGKVGGSTASRLHAGEPGKVGDSAPAEWSPREGQYAVWTGNENELVQIYDSDGEFAKIEIVSGSERTSTYTDIHVDDLEEPDYDQVEMWTKDTPYATEWRAREIFGLTEDPSEAGYILEDGAMLDFSGKREGGSPGRRAYDHRQIANAFVGDKPEYTSGMVWFMQETNTIRMQWNDGYLMVDLAGPPTRSQREVILSLGMRGEGVFWDVSKWEAMAGNSDGRVSTIESGEIGPDYDEIDRWLDSVRGIYYKAKGGPGSGHWGHLGRPGKVGGSAPSELSRWEHRNPKIKQIIKEFSKADRKSKIEHLIIVDSGGKILLNKTGNENSVAFTDQEMDMVKKATMSRRVTMIHNHPTGSPLSIDDVSMLLELGAHEIIAVGNRTTYSMVNKLFGQMEQSFVADFVYEFSRIRPSANYRVATRHGNRVSLQRGSDLSTHVAWLTMEKIHPDLLDYTWDETDQLLQKGGVGSGHWGHAGRPGKVGGSSPSEVSNYTDRHWRFKREMKDFVKRNVDASVERVMCLAEDGEIFFEKVGESNSILFDDNEIRSMTEKQNTTIVHNHPNGLSLSSADIDFMLRYNVDEMVAVGSSGVFMVTNKAKHSGYIRSDLINPFVATGQAVAKQLNVWEMKRPVSREWSPGYAIRREGIWRHLTVLGTSKATGLFDYSWDSVDQFLQKGGPGSGHFDHVGRPGEIGGSMPSGLHAGIFDELEDMIYAEGAIADLDHEVLYVYDSDGMLVAYSKGDTTSVAIAPDQERELRYMQMRDRPVVLLHNHPEPFDSSFSSADLKAAAHYGIDEVRAVTTDKLYVLRILHEDEYHENIRSIITTYESTFNRAVSDVYERHLGMPAREAIKFGIERAMMAVGRIYDDILKYEVRGR